MEPNQIINNKNSLIKKIAIWGLIFDILCVAFGGSILVTFSGTLLRKCDPHDCQVLCDSFATRIVDTTFRTLIFSSWALAFISLLIGPLLLFLKKDLGAKIINIGILFCFCFGVFLICSSLTINICTGFGNSGQIFWTVIFVPVFYWLTFCYFKKVKKIQ
ncbi:MAG: hypothetical protein ABIA97_06625 [Candidatus Omnitrophota bacterium]